MSDVTMKSKKVPFLLRETGRYGALAAMGLLMAACGGEGDIDGGQTPSKDIVQTTSGPVRGQLGDVVAFKGIPYARPPVGELRWTPPQDVEPWTAVRDAKDFGPACIQAADIAQSEDCLTLNVWAPKTAFEKQQSLPVLVWVYGGSFVGGSGNMSADELAKGGAVVVSMNYRVSTMGFMAHPQLTAESPEGTSGNYGLLDIAQALKWVRNNIASFGGDPSRVTVWGLSSGASAITALMVSPKADGLFDQAILNSPGAMRHWKTLEQAERDGLEVGADIEALRKLPAKDVPTILNTGGGTQIRALSEPRVIGPVLDGVVLPHEERPAFERGLARAMPVLTGYTSDEGSYFTQRYPVDTIEAYRAYLKDPKVFGTLGDEAYAHYPVSSTQEIPRAIADSFGDNQFVFGTRGIARAMAERGEPVYRYWFRRKGDGGTGRDPWHGDDLAYVWGDAKFSSAPYTDDDVKLSAAMREAWLRFAATGNPNGGQVKDWPRYDPATEPVYVFDAAPEVVNGPRNSQLDFIGQADTVLNAPPIP